MTQQQTYPPLTPETFGGTLCAGIPLIEFEDGDRWCALGHVDPEQMADAVLAYEIGVHGEIAAERMDPEDVQHLYAITGDPDEESIWWDGVTAEAPGAFPITLVVI